MKRILIIEDDQSTLNALQSEFENSGIETIGCSDFDSADKAIKNNIPFDVVILDWYFVLPDSSNQSKLILKKLREKVFVPVFIYTGHKEDAENTRGEDFGYPKNMIEIYDKTLSSHELNERVNNKLNSDLTYKISLKYRDKIYVHLEKIFFELNDIGSNALGKILKTIYGNGENIDWNNDIVLTLLHRSLISDDIFTADIKNILTSDRTELSVTEFNRKIINKVVYHHGKSDYIRNGDIVKILKNDNSLICYGVIITPDCDLENNKTRYLELIKLENLEKINENLNENKKINIKACFNHGSYYSFPAIKTDGSLKDFVAVLKAKIILQEKDIDQNTGYPEASKRLLYSQLFTLNNSEVRIEFICAKVNPYKAEFLQKLHTNNSRVGIPDIKNLL